MIRLLDILLSAIMAFLLMPLLMLIALAISIDSGSPIIFRQKRVGLNGRVFLMYKFRTMKKDAEKTGPFFTNLDDPRITRIGQFLRKTSLDELPQLWNVLRGDMSIVGPRPLLERQHELLDLVTANTRSTICPGITGLAQVRGRSDSSLNKRLEDDLEYIHTISVRLYLRIIVLTFSQVLFRKGVN